MKLLIVLSALLLSACTIQVTPLGEDKTLPVIEEVREETPIEITVVNPEPPTKTIKVPEYINVVCKLPTIEKLIELEPVDKLKYLRYADAKPIEAERDYISDLKKFNSRVAELREEIKKEYLECLKSQDK